jgi:hypothetical protein
MVLSSRSKDTVRNSLTVLTTRWLEDIMASMREICKLYRKYIRVCSERRLYELGRLLKDDLRFNANANGEYYWTNNGGSKIKVGAHYDSYTFQGNTVVFMVDKILSDDVSYQDTVSVSTGWQTTANWYLNVYIRRA